MWNFYCKWMVHLTVGCQHQNDMCPTYCATVCIGYAYHRGSSSNYAFWCTRHCTGWRQTTLDSSVGLSVRTMLAVLSGLRSAATSSSWESGDKVRRQSIRHLRSSDVEQSDNDSQKLQHLVKLQIALKSHLFTWLFSRLQQQLRSVTAPLNRFYVLWRHRNYRRIIIIIIIIIFNYRKAYL